MSSKDHDDRSTTLTRSVSAVTGWLGSFPAIVVALLVVTIWSIGGLFVKGGFGNNTYQLLINTGTTIVTFLMVFIIQNTQNRDGRAVQAKLDAQAEALIEIACAVGVEADLVKELANLVGIEDAPEKDIKREQSDVRKAAQRKKGVSG